MVKPALAKLLNVRLGRRRGRGEGGGLYALLLSALSANAAGDGLSWFEEVTAAAGVTATHTEVYFITGQTWGDYDGDGRVDLYVTDSGGPNRLYRNSGGGEFAELDGGTAAWSLPGHTSGGASLVDYDNDGRTDLLVLEQGEPVLLRNTTGSGFEDVSASGGLTRIGEGESAAWGDYDNDGDLDLYVVHWYYHEESKAPENKDVLYRNDGGSFTDVTHFLDDARTRGPGFAATFVDYDNDGDLDLYVVNDKQWGNVLWRNDGAGCGESWCFTDVSLSSGAHRPAASMGIATGDYDNDGDLDFSYSSSNEHVLLQNRTSQGAAEFFEVGQSAGVDFTGATAWATTFADFNNDGWLDLYVSVSSGSPDNRNRLFRNDGDGTFTEVAFVDGPVRSGPSMGAAVADYDQDGGLDLVVGDHGDGYRLYRNRNPGTNNWLSVALVGAGPVNSEAIGARALLTDSEGRQQLREVKAGSGLGGSHSRRLHFGLGDATAAALTVRWPDGVETHQSVTGQGRITATHPAAREAFMVDGFESS